VTMPDLSPQYFLVFVAFVLPGAISMYFYSLKVPQEVHGLKDRVLEAVCFSVANIIIIFPALFYLIRPGFIEENILLAWVMVLFFLVVLPAAWPFLFMFVLRWLESRSWIAVQSKTAWDDFFNKARKGCWIIVELNDGRHVGGRFGEQSYASAFPDPGHLYIEELWSIDEGERFVGRLPGGPGVLLRPTDYKYVKVFREV
jgi:hypothetical protein